MRQFLSKSIAGGLSAGVVLVWWPVLFENVDTVTSWFIRGAAWTVCFELLLSALVPVERALWETQPGERIAGRVGAAGTRLQSGSHRRKLGQLSALATVALAVPVVLVVMGVQEQVPAKAEAAQPRPIKVVRVTKVVKVRKVVHPAPVSVAPQTVAPQSSSQPVATAPGRETPPASPDSVAIGRSAPVERESAPPQEPESAETAPAPAPAF
jgi:hypothetical protein